MFKSIANNILHSMAGEDKVIVLAMVDAGYIEMAINFYLTSLRPHNINNYLFVSLSSSACKALQTAIKGCHCLTYMEHQAGSTASMYYTSVFLHKMAVRARFVLDALKWGYRVLHTDLDVVFLQNPLPNLHCDYCDIQVMEDGIKGLMNAGFIYLKASSESIRVYTLLLETLIDTPGAEDQAVLNKIIKVKLEGLVKWKFFNNSQFLCGKDYFEDPKRYFSDSATPCSHCMVAHNNWIVSTQAKIYRFKEMHMWLMDGNEQYYSSKDRKYLTFENYFNSRDGNNVWSHELEALKNAFVIGFILNRTVILPRFHCGDTWCPLNSKLYISNFDRVFSDGYRENSFLKHPLVPSTIKGGISQYIYQIQSPQNEYVDITNETKANIKQLKPRHSDLGASLEEIRHWFGHNYAPVLRFHSLHGTISMNKETNGENLLTALEDEFSVGLKKAEYRQY